MQTIWTGWLGTELRQTYYNAGGVRTRCIEAGSGKPLLFLHGTGGHAEAYARNIVEHAKHFHVYAVDMVGHGFSDAPDIAYDYEDYVNWLLALMDAIGADRAMISGESLGAMVAQLFAIRHPERATKVVLNTGMMWPPSAKNRQELLDVLERSRKASAGLTRELVRKRLEWLMHDPVMSVTEELIETRFTIYSQPGRAAAMRKVTEASIGGILAERFAETYCKPQFLARAKCPSLVLWTRHNPGQSLDVAQEGVKHIPQSRLVVMEKSAHWPQWEEPDEFNRLHLDFLMQ
jgi:2-hydroxy-6-oxonona-2,4-dienedioate hydrolase